MNGMDVKSLRCCLMISSRRIASFSTCAASESRIDGFPPFRKKTIIFIAFQKTSIAHFRPILKDIQIHLFGEAELSETDHVIILDMPPGTEQMKELINRTNPKRVYAHFFVNESLYFEGIPSREHFGWYYSFLKKRGSFDFGSKCRIYRSIEVGKSTRYIS